MIQTFTTWFTALDPTLRIYWACALVFSLIFLVQMVLAFIGLDGHDVDTTFDTADFGSADGDTLDSGGGLSLFSVRSIVNFFLGLGWGGVSFHSTIASPTLLLLASLASGCVFVWVFFLILRQTRRFEANGAFRIERCKGRTARVYLHIPAHARGKIQISVGGAYHEIDALSTGADLPTGTTVRVTDIIDGQTVRVEPV